MQRLSLSLALDHAAAGPGGEYRDECAALREAVCDAAGVNDPQQALQAMRARDPGRLRALLKEHGNFSDQVGTSADWAMMADTILPRRCPP